MHAAMMSRLGGEGDGRGGDGALPRTNSFGNLLTVDTRGTNQQMPSLVDLPPVQSFSGEEILIPPTPKETMTSSGSHGAESIYRSHAGAPTEVPLTSVSSSLRSSSYDSIPMSDGDPADERSSSNFSQQNLDRTVTMPYIGARTASTASTVFRDEKVTYARDFPTLIYTEPVDDLPSTSADLIPPCDGSCAAASGCRRCHGNRASRQNRVDDSEEEAPPPPPLVSRFGFHDHGDYYRERTKSAFDTRHQEMRELVDLIVQLTDHNQVWVDGQWHLLTESSLIVSGPTLTTRRGYGPCWYGLTPSVGNKQRLVADEEMKSPEERVWEKSSSYRLRPLSDQDIAQWYHQVVQDRLNHGVRPKHPLLDHRSSSKIEHDDQLISEVYDRSSACFQGFLVTDDDIMIDDDSFEGTAVRSASFTHVPRLPKLEPFVRSPAWNGQPPVIGVRTSVALAAGAEIVVFGRHIIHRDEYLKVRHPLIQPLDLAGVREVKNSEFVIDVTPFSDMISLTSATDGPSTT
ncbi:hypothetical protein, partial [Telmatospirillum sp.]|uniref:hypothetical protein n=1 Tax=Telmatospirillum sp. TaxID=2079197 RepID=UPI00283D93C5